MAFFTGKGDGGTTNIFGCGQKISKSSTLAQALGSLDEINSFLGLCKVQSAYLGYDLGKSAFAEIIHEMQENLFIIQAELAGAPKSLENKKVQELEDVIKQIEGALPPIKTFFISGSSPEINKWQQSGAGLGALLDTARAIARRAERSVIAAKEEMSQFSLPVIAEEGNNKQTDGKKDISEVSMSYLNRLSSALYALARYANHKAGIMEEAPDYR